MMSSPLSLFTEGGPFMFVVLGLAVCSLLPTVLWTALGLSKRRAPLTLWLLGPGAVLLAGSLGTILGIQQAAEAISYGSVDIIPTLAAMGTSMASVPSMFGRWCAAALLALGAWGAGLGAVVATGPDARRTLLAGVLGLLVAGAGSVILPLWGIFSLEASLTVVPATLLVGFAALGTAIGSFRRGVGPHAHRVGAMRMASYVQALLCAWHVGAAMEQWGHMEQLRIVGSAGPSSLPSLVAAASQAAEVSDTFAWALLIWALLLGAVTTLAELGDIMVGGTIADLVLSALGLGVVFGAHSYQQDQIDRVSAQATHGPIATVLADRLVTLPRAVHEDEVVMLGLPAFGDVLQEKGGHWTRTQVWADQTWTPDSTALEQAGELSHPLLVIDGGANAESLSKALMRTEAATLLLAGTAEPPEQVDAKTAYTLVQGLSVVAVDSAAAASGPWVVAGDTHGPYLGGVRWLDPQLGRGALERLPDIAAELGEVTILAGRGRVDDVVALCLSRPDPMEPCPVLVGSTLGQFRQAAAEAVPADPAGVLITRLRTTGELDTAEVRAQLEPHLGNIAKCGGLAKQASEDGSGRWSAVLTVSGTGRVSQVEAGRRNSVAGTFLEACLLREVEQIAVGTSVEGGEVDLQLYLP